MAAISDKINSLREKISAKEKKLFSNQVQLKAAKVSIKALKKEIADIKTEIHKLQMQQLSETLSQNGISTEEIEQAIAAGIFEKPKPVIPTSETEQRATYSTTENEQEVTKNEVSSS